MCFLFCTKVVVIVCWIVTVSDKGAQLSCLPHSLKAVKEHGLLWPQKANTTETCTRWEVPGSISGKILGFSSYQTVLSAFSPTRTLTE